MTIEEMLAREAIRDTVAIYNRAVDEGDYDALRHVFLPDGVLRVQGGAAFEGSDAIVEGLTAGAARRGSSDAGNFQRHHLGAAMIRVEGPDRAVGRHYITVVTEIGIDHAGRYDDVYCRVGERWLIRERLAQMEWADDRSRFIRWLGAAEPAR